MTNFIDANGSSWPLEINVFTVKQLRSICNIDILEPSGDVITKLSEDPIMLADVLYVCCKSEAEKRGISDEDFGRALRGDALDSAVDAFIEEFILFSPKQKAALLRKAVQKTAQMKEQAVMHVEKMIDEAEFKPSILSQALSE